MQRVAGLDRIGRLVGGLVLIGISAVAVLWLQPLPPEAEEQLGELLFGLALVTGLGGLYLVGEALHLREPVERLWQRISGSRTISEGLEQVAGERGFRFTAFPDKDSQPLATLHFPLIRERGAAYDLVHGTWHGLDFLVFRYLVSGLGEYVPNQEFFCAAIPTGIDCPWTMLSKETTWERLKRRVGVRDIEVGDPRFDGTFKVTCARPAFARFVLTEDLRRWLVHLPMDEFWLEFAGSWAMLSRRASRDSWETITPMLDTLRGLSERLPRELPETLPQ